MISSSFLPDIAMQNVSLAFRNNPRFEITRPLGNVGWRAKKNYFQVNYKYEVNELFTS
jgi:hypothetical protein